MAGFRNSPMTSAPASILAPGPPTVSPTSKPPRKRRRPAVVCAECRRRKIACDRKTPCGQCALHHVECVYVTGSVPPQYGRPARPESPGSQRGEPLDWLNTGVAATKLGSEARDAKSLVQDMPIDEPSNFAVQAGEQSSRFSGGRLAKTRLFGRTHWMNNMDQFKDINAITNPGLVAETPLHKSLRRCKRLGRLIKTEQRRRIMMPVREGDAAWFSPPPRAVCDFLVDLYFNVFESTVRVLHMPTFQREYNQYWDLGADAAAATDAAPSNVFLVKLILVLALGSCFYDGPESLQDDLRIAAARAVHKFEVASCTPLEKNRLTLDTLQAYCLVLIARQTNALDMGDDLIWFSVGSLLHTALGMGLNRDPSHFKSLSPFQCEMRRRLWATILELVVQSGLDQGMPPLISTDDYDTLPPTNLNDSEIEGPHADRAAGNENANGINAAQASCGLGDCWSRERMSSQRGHPDTVFTQASMQRLLFRSLPCRLKIVKALNGLGASLSYGRALQLSTDLLEAIRYTATTLRTAPLMVESAVAGLQEERAGLVRLRNLFYEVLTRRFHHSLHSPFARKAANDVQFFYSRRARVESAVKVLCMFQPPSLGGSSQTGGSGDLNTDNSRQGLCTGKAVDDPCRQLALVGRGLFKCTLIDMSATVAIETVLQLQEDFTPGADLSMSQRELYGIGRSCLLMLRARIEAGETNVKSYIFFAGGVAQVDALMEGRMVRQDIMDAVHSVSEEAHEMLRSLAVRRNVLLPEDLGGDDLDAPSLAVPPVTLRPGELMDLGGASMSIADTVLFGELEADSVDADSGVHFPGTDISATGSSSDAWTDDFIVDPQDDFGAGNWFYPYNDCIGSGL